MVSGFSWKIHEIAIEVSVTNSQLKLFLRAKLARPNEEPSWFQTANIRRRSSFSFLTLALFLIARVCKAYKVWRVKEKEGG